MCAMVGSAQIAQKKSIPCDEHVCLFIERSNFTWMGYSVRTEGWRYTEWVQWDGSHQKPLWERMAGVELYPHKEYAGESDFDAWENLNEADSPKYDDVKAQLSAVLHAQFDSDSVVDLATFYV